MEGKGNGTMNFITLWKLNYWDMYDRWDEVN
jgi:hypothetical protein